MAKEKAIADMIENRITDHQLTKIHAFESQLKQGAELFGGLSLQYEFQKSSLLSQIAKVDDDYSKFKNDLKEQYGDIDIDTSTGIFTKKEE